MAAGFLTTSTSLPLCRVICKGVIFPPWLNLADLGGVLIPAMTILSTHERVG